MISDAEIKHLTELARLAVPEEEKDALRRDLASILDYVSQLKEAADESVPAGGAERRNVMRPDGLPHPPVPSRQFKVKKIL